jgi:hypothetical protein
MKEDLWKSFALKHRYDPASRDDLARRERLRRVVDDIAYALYKGKMATAARVSRPYVASANHAWLSAEFITPTQQQQRRASPPSTSPGKWHTKKQRRVASPPRQSLAESPPAPKPRAPMNSESNDEFFARTQFQRTHGGARY